MFFLKKKKEKNFEKKFGELEAEMFSEKNCNDSHQTEQRMVERLEQMLELTKEIEDEKSEYRMVTSYLNDIQTIESLPEEEHEKIAEIAVNVVQLNAARTEFLNAAQKLSDAQFTQFEQMEAEIPTAIRRLSANEMYRDTLKKDIKYLEREKSEWVLRKEYLIHQISSLRYLLYVMVGIAATAAVILGILQIVLEMDMFYGWMIWVFATAIIVCLIYLRMQNDSEEIGVAERCQNRAISLQNKVKIKYVNIENAVDYVCEKYHVESASELSEEWEYYLETVKEREKYKNTNEDLEYFKGRLVRMLSKYQFYDAQVWVAQALALVDPKEMVEVKHGLVNRRQKLRERIEYNMQIIKENRKEAEQLINQVGQMRPQVEQILSAIDRLNENQ